MPTIVITRGDDGKVDGLSWADQRAYRRFKRRLDGMVPGDTLEFSWKAARSAGFHRRHFLMLRWVFDNQETFVGEYELRKWGEIGAGHCAWIPGADGEPQAIPKSIDYMSLDDDEFRELHLAVKDFMRSPRGLATLWPHADPIQAWHAIDQIMEGIG
jgi:hypothetical protein